MPVRDESVQNFTDSKFNRKLVVKLFDKFPLLTVTTKAKSGNKNDVSTSSQKH